eukprot:1155078-Pelagomonas_calceolata.AAC.2
MQQRGSARKAARGAGSPWPARYFGEAWALSSHAAQQPAHHQQLQHGLPIRVSLRWSNKPVHHQELQHRLLIRKEEKGKERKAYLPTRAAYLEQKRKAGVEFSGAGFLAWCHIDPQRKRMHGKFYWRLIPSPQRGVSWFGVAMIHSADTCMANFTGKLGPSSQEQVFLPGAALIHSAAHSKGEEAFDNFVVSAFATTAVLMSCGKPRKCLSVVTLSSALMLPELPTQKLSPLL